ncbi:hypothetical protein ACMSIO_20505 [Pseudomonas benzopyrenica]|uniref:hypothetical protein n=1 Tax=Pseudomonas benzopyrenica TaxID=2993566 RepID=UPI0039C166FD
MGVIFEFYAVPAGPELNPLSVEADEVVARSHFVESFSVNSHSVGELFDALSCTDLAGLIGNGSDTSRALTVPSAQLAALLAQVSAWSNSPLQVLIDAQIVVADAVEEVRFRQQDLLVMVM